jgi:hypothetical protein
MKGGALMKREALGIVLGGLLLIALPVWAENTDPLNEAAQYAFSENAGWMNAEPDGDGGPGLTIYGDRVEGYMWAENFGWINLSPVGFGGVINDGEGNLSGYAWSENAGWINFAPSGGGVRLDIFTGNFSGWAWGENIGWINFDMSTQIQNAARTSWSIWEEDGDPVNNWDADPDNDGLVNLVDPDADNDGLENEVELAMWGVDWNVDIDGDGLYNLIDADADGDGALDGEDPNPGIGASVTAVGVFGLLSMTVALLAIGARRRRLPDF